MLDPSLDEYRHAAAAQLRDEGKPEPAVSVDPDIIRAGVEESSELDERIAASSKIVEDTTNPSSPKADSLLETAVE